MLKIIIIISFILIRKRNFQVVTISCFSRRLEDVLKLSWKTRNCYVEDVLEDIFKTCLEDVPRRLGDQTKLEVEGNGK